MDGGNKTLELQIRVATEEAIASVSALKGSLQAFAAEAGKLAGGGALAGTLKETEAAAGKAAASFRLFGASGAELRQVQERLKTAAVELVSKGFDPQSEEIKNLIAEYRRLGKEAEELDEAAGKNIESFGDLQRTMMGLAEVKALSKVLSYVKDLGAFALKTADDFQTMRGQFGILLGDMKAGAGLFNEIKAFNDKTPFDMATLTQATNVLIAAKVPLKDLQSQLTKLGDLAQGSSQKMASYANAFSQAAAKGKADMQVLNTYLHQGVPILDELAQNFGVTTAAVVEMASSGQIGFEDFSKALDGLTAAGGRYFGGMELASGSLAAMQEGLQESVNSLAASFGEMLMPAALGVTSALTWLTDAINDSPILKGLLAGAVVALTGVLGAMAVKAVALTVKTWLAYAAQMGFNTALSVTNPLLIAGIAAAALATAGFVAYAASMQDAERKTSSFAYAQLKQKNETQSAAESIRAFTAALQEMPEMEAFGTLRNLRRELADLQEDIAELADRADEAFDRGNTRLGETLDYQAAELQRDAAEVRREIAAAERVVGGNAANWIGSMFGGTNAGKIQKTNEQLEIATAYLNGAGLDGSQKSKLEHIIAKLRSELEKLRNPAADGVKTWQQWFAEITKTDPAKMGETGASAAQAYIDGIKKSLERESGLAGALGESLDVPGILRSRKEDVQKALSELLAIDPSKIDQPFSLADASVLKLIQSIQILDAEIGQAVFEETLAGLARETGNLAKSERDLAYEAELARLGLEAQSGAALELKQAMDRLDAEKTLAALDEEVRNLGKDQHGLALETLRAAGATEEEIRQAEKAAETLRRYGEGFEEFFARRVAEGLEKAFSKMEKQAAQAIGNVCAQLASMSFDGVLDGLAAVGRAFAENGSAAESLRDALVSMCDQILRQLPTMFLQAGLQLIASGQWALGLGFIAAAGASAVISGFVEGKQGQAASKHAQGGIFEEHAQAARAFAAGGAFANQVVSRPTPFRYGGGLGVMGEEGPEAILPLRRMPSGNLGVETSGSAGPRVFVSVINNTGEEARMEETEDAGGNIQVGVIIGQAVNSHIASGKADRAMRQRFGLRAAGA